MTSSDLFESRLRESWPPPTWADVTVLVAVSGGADSVALLRGLTSIRRECAGAMVAVHFNHGTRGCQSDADEAFVLELCRRLEMPCFTSRSAKTQVGDAESAMRKARYDFLLAEAEKAGARYLVTAHTADDQAETILHRIIRGTGLSGLAGIPRVRSLNYAVSVVRPMLSIRRDEVLAYLARLNQPYREDASNRDLQYTRNRIRHELLPQLQVNYNTGVVDSLLRLGQLAGETQQVITDQVDILVEECVAWEDERCVRVDCSRLVRCRPHLVRELFIRLWRKRRWPQQAMGYQHWNTLCAMAREAAAIPGQRMKLPGGVDVHRTGDCLRLELPAQ